MLLAGQAEQQWGTPTSHERTHTPRDVDHGTQLANQVGRRLNPNFVDWLMGWVPGWTACAPLGTEWSRYRRRLRSTFSRIVRGLED